MSTDNLRKIVAAESATGAGKSGLPAPGEKGQLRAGALRFREVLMQGIAHTAPATAILLTLPFISSKAGVVAPLAYLTAFLTVVMLGISLTQLAKHFASAGGYFTYVSHTVHPRVGFLVSWLFFLYSATSPAFSLAMMGFAVEAPLRAAWGIHLPWWLLVLFGTAFTFWVTYRGIEISAAALLVLSIVEMTIVMALAAWGLFTPGSGGLNVVSFDPANTPSGNGFYLGVVFSIFALTGWEGVVPLAEESENPRKIVPRAIVGTILIMGAYLVFTSWGILVGWGTNDVAGLVASKELPPFVLARRLWGSGWVVVLFALVNSMLAVAVATTLVSTRMWFAMARSGALPASFAAVHPKFKTPTPAICFQTLVTLAVGLGLGFWIGPEDEYTLMGTVVTLALAFIYSAGNLGVFLFYRRRPAEFHPLLHVVFPAVSTIVVLWVAYRTTFPLPPPPVTYAPIIVGIWLLLGLAVLAVMKARGREEWLLKAGAAAQEGKPNEP